MYVASGILLVIIIAAKIETTYAGTDKTLAPTPTVTRAENDDMEAPLTLFPTPPVNEPTQSPETESEETLAPVTPLSEDDVDGSTAAEPSAGEPEVALIGINSKSGKGHNGSKGYKLFHHSKAFKSGKRSYGNLNEPQEPSKDESVATSGPSVPAGKSGKGSYIVSNDDSGQESVEGLYISHDDSDDSDKSGKGSHHSSGGKFSKGSYISHGHDSSGEESVEGSYNSQEGSGEESAEGWHASHDGSGKSGKGSYHGSGGKSAKRSYVSLGHDSSGEESAEGLYVSHDGLGKSIKGSYVSHNNSAKEYVEGSHVSYDGSGEWSTSNDGLTVNTKQVNLVKSWTRGLDNNRFFYVLEKSIK